MHHTVLHGNIQFCRRSKNKPPSNLWTNSTGVLITKKMSLFSIAKISRRPPEIHIVKGQTSNHHVTFGNFKEYSSSTKSINARRESGLQPNWYAKIKLFYDRVEYVVLIRFTIDSENSESQKVLHINFFLFEDNRFSQLFALQFKS